LSPRNAGVSIYDDLQEQCGKNAECSGFSEQGVMVLQPFDVDRPFVENPSTTKLGTVGIYKKTEALMACQSGAMVAEWAEEQPHCWRMKQFPSRAQAEAERCYFASTGAADAAEAVVPGLCRLRGRSKLQGFARTWSRRMAELAAPGVPSTFLWLTNLPTETKWFAKDWFAPMEPLETAPGDGSVTAKAVEGPCQQFRLAQGDARPVHCQALNIPGVDHETMVNDKAIANKILEVAKL